MGFYIQDDFWDAAQVLPERDQDKLFGALIRLFYTGKESDLSGVAAALFVAFKQRVLIARKRSDAGKAKPESKRTSNDESKPESNKQSKPNQTGNQIGNQNTEQNEIKSKKSESESERERESKNLDSSNAESRERKRFAPPTREEWLDYSRSKGYDLADSERLFNHYVSNGWKVGKNPMKDWKASQHSNLTPKGGAANANVGESLGEYAGAF